MAHLDLQTATFEAAERLLGGRDSRKIGHNTRLERRSRSEPRSIAVQYHATDIVTLSTDGTLTVNTGGWHTVTTLTRINALLPGRWRIGSAGKRGNYLWHNGHAITPYVDGIAIDDTAGTVGINGATLLTAADVAAIESAAEVADQERAVKRAARLLREHPAVDAPRSHRGYDHRAYDCERCRAELAAESAAHRIRLHAEHVAMAAMAATLARNPDDAAPWAEAEYQAAGSHVTRTETREYPPLPGAEYPAWQRDYSAEPTLGVAVRIACPWSCPDRTGY